ncbi:MAG: 2-amino-4-hydroxy-6-hydroxymethyldihydropteridine diphosphokinase [Proteobacteria bacterium]|nr:2-amino-4-hydroxy-6-hydroxymethyldihydropteridine diphosphokinase [Pseudomonadota bacterium]
MSSSTVILGLGSNMGDRMGFLTRAVQSLSKHVLKDMMVSPIYASDAEVPEGADTSYHQPFYNIAVAGKTDKAAFDVLKSIRELEAQIGFHDHTRKWAPREIDIDILAYGDQIIEDKTLVVPHPQLMKRPFALLPLLDVAPEWRHPLTKETAASVATQWKRAGVPFATTKTREVIVL